MPKEQALNSTSSVTQFYTPATSVGGMSVQEAKVYSTGKPNGWCLMNCSFRQIVVFPKKTYRMFINQLFLLQTRRAEVKVAVAMVQHNIPFSAADHFSPLYNGSEL